MPTRDQLERLLGAWGSQAAVENTTKRAARMAGNSTGLLALGLGRPPVPFTRWEMKFLGSLADRVGRYGYDLRFSEKQTAVLDRLLEQIGVLPPADAPGNEGAANGAGPAVRPPE